MLHIRLWLDDVRDPRYHGQPPETIWVVTHTDAMAHILNGQVAFISFDHDLGSPLTGYDLAKDIEKLCARGDIECPEWAIHSANPVGRDNIQMAMVSAKRLSDLYHS